MPRILFFSSESAWLGRRVATLCCDVVPRVWEVSYTCPARGGAETRAALLAEPVPGETASETASATRSIIDDGAVRQNTGVRRPRQLSLFEATARSFDVVVQLNDKPLPPDLVFAGLPIRICWRPQELGIPDVPAGEELAGPARRALDEVLLARLREFFRDPLLEAGLRIRLTFGSLINHLTEGVMAHDRSRTIFLWNRTAELITGYNAAEVIGRDCHQVFPDRFCGGDCSFCAKPGHNRARLRYPKSFVRRDGVVRDIEMSVVTLDTDDRGVIGALVIFRDMTELNTLRRKTSTRSGFHGMIGKHPAMLTIYESIEELAHVNVPILIQGESGTGKEMVAKALHEIGPRAKKPFVPVNCGALPEGTLESELFGHVRGAFTGAIRDKKGRFELADEGILFLDEIGEITAGLQVKLLRVLQEGQFVPVGGEKPVQVDVQILCATNRNLKQMARQGNFREDLYYRLAVVPITLPPLRERTSDIPALVEYYLEQVSTQIGAERVQVSPDAMNLLATYPWPGNVRELRNAIQYGIIKAHSGLIQPHHLPPEILEHVGPPRVPAHPGRPPKLHVREVRDVMARVDGNKAKAARLLGVSRTTLYKMLEQLE